MVYIPLAAEPQLSTLKQEGKIVFLRELERLATLGSPWASALLGYQALLLKPDGTRDIEKAIQLCMQPAASGDAYAAYILGWATFLRGNPKAALAYFRRATRQLFPPAIVDSVSFFWMSHWRREPKRVLVSLRQARIAGHHATFFFRCKIYQTGKLGVARLLVGYLLAPVARLYLLVAVWADPFSARSFAFHVKTPSRALEFRD